MQAIRSLLLGMAVAGAAGSVPAAETAGNPQSAGNHLILSDRGIIAYDSHTLQSRWQLLHGEQTDDLVMADGLILVTSGSGLHVIHPAAGSMLWQKPSDTRLFPPTVAGETAYVAGEDGRLQALELHTGRLLWQRQFPGWIYPPAVLDDRLFTGGSDGRLWALGRTDGSLLWERSLGQEMVYRPVVSKNGELITTNFNGEIHAFSSQGDELWQKRLPAVLLSPIEIGGRLIFSGLDNRLYGLASESGETLWITSLGGRLAAPMVQHHQGSLLASLDDGRVMEINTTTGSSQMIHRVNGEPVAAPFHLGGRTLLFIKSFGAPRVIILNRRIGDNPPKEI